MPYKNIEDRKENFRKYWINVQKKKRETEDFTWVRYVVQRSQAKLRGIKWEFTFEDWCEVWQDSGYWGKRGGGQGYVMCRKGDIGPYSIDNVYIASNSENGKDAWKNGKTQHLPEPKLTLEQRLEIANHEYERGDIVKIAKQYGISKGRVFQIKKEVINVNSSNSRFAR